MARARWRAAMTTFAIAAAATTLVGCSQGSSGPTSSPSASDNGVSALTAQEILTKATDAAKAQSSVQIVTAQGTATNQTTISVNINKTAGGSGSMTSEGQTVQFYATEANTWIKATKEFWTKNANAAAAELIGTKWVKVPNTNPAFATFSGFGNYSAAMGELLSPEGTITKGELTTVNGQPAIALVGAKGRLLVATTGQPLPLQIQSNATDGGTVTFSQWGSANVGSAPAADDTIDFEKLQG